MEQQEVHAEPAAGQGRLYSEKIQEMVFPVLFRKQPDVRVSDEQATKRLGL